MPAATAADVPGKYDVVINGFGYVLADQIEPSLPFRTHRAIYGMSDTFIERSNITGSYGDNTQDFFLVASQNDWSLGEQQRYFHSADADKVRRYWFGQNLDVVTVPGQVTIRQQMTSVTFGASVRAVETMGPGSDASGYIAAASSANLYYLTPAGGGGAPGAHGLGNTPARTGLASDGANLYMTTSAAGTVGVRKFSFSGGSFSTFSASAADSLEFLNNTLYGFRATTADLVRYDAAGALTSLFSWKNADGAARGGTFSRLRNFGGKLLCLWSDGPEGGELWVYDGNGVSLLQILPPNFFAYEMCVQFGVVFIGGSHVRLSNGTSGQWIMQPAIYYYANGTLGKLYQGVDLPMIAGTPLATFPTAGNACVAPYAGGVVFNDDNQGMLMYYDAALGGIHGIGSYAVAGDTPLIAGSEAMVLHTRDQAAAWFYPDTSQTAAFGVLITSLFDFDNSLIKYIKSVKIDFEAGTDGNGGSIDLYYRLDTVLGAYTLLQTGAAAGTEYTIGMSAHSVSIKLVLNKGTSTKGPTLKRTYVSAAPILNTKRNCQYNFDLSGAADGVSRRLRDDTSYMSETGAQQAAHLFTTMKLLVPISITDRFGTYTGIIEPSKSEFYEVHPGLGGPPSTAPSSGTFIARITTREV